MSNGRGGKKPSVWLRLLPSLSIILFLTLWELAVRLRGIPPIVLPAPSSISIYLVNMIADGSLPYHMAVTFARIMAGFLVAGFFGVLFGVLMGMSSIFSRIIDPWIAALYPLPKISLIPLLIIWLGTGEWCGGGHGSPKLDEVGEKHYYDVTNNRRPR